MVPCPVFGGSFGGRRISSLTDKYFTASMQVVLLGV